MKKNSFALLVLTLVLVVVAAIVWCVGGSQVRINAHATYDRAAVEEAMNKAGFKNPVLLETNRTSVEVQTGAMSDSALKAAADKLLASVQVTNPDAELVFVGEGPGADEDRQQNGQRNPKALHDLFPSF